MPTIATTMRPTKNSLRPIASEASEIEPTRISDMTPTATPAHASTMTEVLTDHRASSTCSSAPAVGLNSALCDRSEKNRPAA